MILCLYAVYCIVCIMTSPNASFVERENPRLHAALESVHEATRPIVASLGRVASFDGVVLFIRDRHYTDTAASVAAVNTEAQGNARFDFQNANINGHRVDLSSSTVGDTFRTKTSEFAQSKMNPNQHIVWGAPVPGAEDDAVLQFAFSPQYGSLPDSAILDSEWDKNKHSISNSAITLLEISRSLASVSDELLLDVPTTPNAYVLNWDLNGSTGVAESNYPILRHYLNYAGRRFEGIVSDAGGALLNCAGDGQVYRFDLPSPEVDRNDPYTMGRYGDTVILPAARALFTAHNQLAAHYKPYIGPIRIGIELGCYEMTSLGESSPSLWSIAKSLESLPRNHNALSLGRTAQNAIELYRSLEKK